jgi:1-aminocyclopropane-1-carboxylate deaminase/D-cysteine desulfhydrase-like pyridoxal-dependent ACC family enzyme
MQLINSPVTHFNLDQRTIYVKRDELLSSDFSGNKARKLAYFLANPPPNIETLISYGGTQSNLMFSLSCLAKLNNWQFIYYVRTLSEQARAANNGNLMASLANGMSIIELKEEFYSTTRSLIAEPEQLIITQGGAQAEAEFGISQLAHE